MALRAAVSDMGAAESVKREELASEYAVERGPGQVHNGLDHRGRLAPLLLLLRPDVRKSFLQVPGRVLTPENSGGRASLCAG